MSELLNSLPEPQVRSKMYQACVDIYNEMLHEAVRDADLQADIWTGSVVKLVESLGFYPRKASESRAHLERMGCVQYLQIGRSRKPSIIQLMHPPTPELWVGTKPSLRDAYRPAELVELGLLNRVDQLEQQMKSVLEFLAEQFPTVVKKRKPEYDTHYVLEQDSTIWQNLETGVVDAEEPHDVGRGEVVSSLQADDGGSEHAALDTGLDEQGHDRGVSDGELPMGQDTRTEDDSDSQ